MSTTYIDDHRARAIGLLGAKVRGVLYVTDLVGAVADETQGAEDAAYDLALASSVEGAYGDQLDRIGALVGERRDGLSDQVYRRFVAGASQIRFSEGTGPQLIELCATLTGSPDVRLYSLGGANLLIDYVVPIATPDDLRPRIKARMLRATAAGVDLALIESVGLARADDELVFLFDESPGFDGPGMGVYY